MYLQTKQVHNKTDIENVKVNANIVKCSCFSRERERNYHLHTPKLRLEG